MFDPVMVETIHPLASDPGTVSTTSLLLVEALRPLVSAAGIAVAGFLSAWIFRKTKLDLSKTIVTVFELAIGYAEQQAKRKAGTGGSLSNEEKKAAAMKMLETLAKDFRLPKWATEQASDLIEAHLGLASKATSRAAKTLKDLSPALGEVADKMGDKFGASL